MTAPTPAAAVYAFELRGFSDVKLHTDDAGAFAAAETQRVAQARGLAATRASPDEELRGRRGGSFLWFLAGTANKLRAAFAGGGLLLVVAVLSGALSPIQAVLFGAAGIVLVVAVARAAFVPVAGYQRLLVASMHSRWREVLDLLPSVERYLPPFEAATRRATALAGLGRMGEALAAMREIEGTMPKWLYLSRLSSVYAAGGDAAEQLRATEAAAEEAPDNATAVVDLALLLLRRAGDPVRIEGLLAKAKAQPLADGIDLGFEIAEGSLASERGEHASAVARLSAVREKIAAAARLQGPMWEGILAIADAHLALALARLGRSDEASMHLSRGEVLLSLTPVEAGFLARCREAIARSKGERGSLSVARDGSEGGLSAP